MKKLKLLLLVSILVISTISFASSNYEALLATFPILVNGEKISPDKPALVVDGCTYLPLKAMGQVLNVNVNWNSKLNRVEIEDEVIVRENKSNFKEIYSAYKENSMRAEEMYEGNEYTITCTPYSIKRSNGKVSISASVFYNSTECYILCIFDEKNQKDLLENVDAGDRITFKGTCSNWANWKNCRIIKITKD